MSESKPRILLITRNMPPLVGGMERLNWHMAQQLATWAEVQVICPAGAAALAPAEVAVHEVPLRPLWRFLVSSMRTAVRVARTWKPDMVLAGSGLTAPLARFAASLCGARAAAYLHGLDVAVRHPVYQMLWLPAIRRMDVIMANSGPTSRLAVAKSVPEACIRLVHPGVDLPEQPGDEDAGAAFRRAHGLATGPILLSVGRLTERKGLREFVTDVLPGVAAVHGNVQLVVIGAEADDALVARSQSQASIRQAATTAGVAGMIHFIGVITDRDSLSQAYRAASVHVFPVRELAGDPEGFGMVAIEAAAHGLATAAYATGGVVDAVAQGVSGRLVTPGDAASLVAAIKDLLESPLPNDGMQAFAGGFAWPAFGARVREALR